jgi:hypothetical protein
MTCERLRDAKGEERKDTGDRQGESFREPRDGERAVVLPPHSSASRNIKKRLQVVDA